jgi:hypothetical protein
MDRGLRGERRVEQAARSVALVATQLTDELEKARGRCNLVAQRETRKSRKYSST